MKNGDDEQNIMKRSKVVIRTNRNFKCLCFVENYFFLYSTSINDILWVKFLYIYIFHL